MKLWKNKKIVAYVCVLFLSYFLVGCSSTELEERSFPMLVAVDLENGTARFKDAFPKEDSTGPLGTKEKDYSHLKVMAFEEEVLEQQTAYESVLREIAQKEQFPRNTYVCVLEDTEDLFEMGEKLSQDLGTYLEEYLKSHEKDKEKLLTLGDLLDERENQNTVIYLPYLEVEENMLQWNGYMNNRGKIWKESQLE